MDQKSNNTYKKLILLITIFLMGFISLFSLNQVFTNLINQLDKETQNLEARLTIGEFIAYDIVKIRSLFSELATTTTSKRSREIIKEDIRKNLKIIEESIKILENGGTLKRNIALNIAGHLNTTKTIHYKKIDNEKFSLEVIDIKPKLNDINIMIEEVEALLKKRSNFRKITSIKEFRKDARELRRYYKALPAFFNRMSENIRRLLYEGEIELNTLKNKIDEDKTKYLRLKLTLIAFVILTVLVLGYIIIKRVNADSLKLYELNIDLNKNLEKQERQEKYIRAILDAQPNIIIVSDGEHMIDANKQLFKFFDQYKTVEEFKKDKECICEFFDENIPSDEYVIKKDYDGLNWSEYILANPDKNLKVILKKYGVKKHFSIQITKEELSKTTNESMVIVTLNDITAEINSQVKLKSLNDNLELIVENKTKELQELNENLEQRVIIESEKVRKKDKQMMQQARFAALGEMIGNIAHQWRQPLSAITSTSSGMQLQIELGLTNDQEVKESFGKIMGYVDFLTETIEDFRGFFKEDKETIDFNMVETIDKSLSITSASYKDNDINVVLKVEGEAKEFISHGMPNELSQVFLNVLNNAKDATMANDIDHKEVLVTCKIEDNYNVVYIQDNAGGIPDDIMEKIFDPYFTTKHQSQGTGIGLYMSKDIIEKHLDGLLSVKNQIVNVDDISYNGACFRVAIPKIEA